MSYSVTRINRHELQYAEEGRVVTVEVESGFDRPISGPIRPEHVKAMNLVVHVSGVERWDDGEPITTEDRERLASNISDALRTAGTKHVVA